MRAPFVMFVDYLTDICTAKFPEMEISKLHFFLFIEIMLKKILHCVNLNDEGRLTQICVSTVGRRWFR